MKTVHLKKVIIIFLNLATFAFSTSVFHIMCKSSYGFHFIGSLYKIKNYNRIKKYFHFTSLWNLLEILFLFMKKEQRIWDRKRCIPFVRITINEQHNLHVTAANIIVRSHFISLLSLSFNWKLIQQEDIYIACDSV